jgi:23S rRNA pseudouridine1911/1915/1917 synthase
MPKTPYIELPGVEPIPILYEDRGVLAIDKPRGWMLVPFSWQKTSRNLQAALVSSLAAGDHWARSRGLRFIRCVHRLDTDTTGVLLFAKSMGGLQTYGNLFESRRMDKTYLAVVQGSPKEEEWTCRLRLAQDLDQRGRMRIDARRGKEAETRFRVLQTLGGRTLLAAHPLTGRTHQLRVHLAESGFPIIGDELYSSPQAKDDSRMGLRAVRLAYTDPFTRRPVDIRAPFDQFVRAFGFDVPEL